MGLIDCPNSCVLMKWFQKMPSTQKVGFCPLNDYNTTQQHTRECHGHIVCWENMYCRSLHLSLLPQQASFRHMMSHSSVHMLHAFTGWNVGMTDLCAWHLRNSVWCCLQGQHAMTVPAWELNMSSWQPPASMIRCLQHCT